MKHGARLTGRGIVLLALSALAAIAAAAIGEPDVLALALTVALLPLLAACYLFLAPPRLTHEREVEPPMVPIGESARVVLRVANDAPAQSGTVRISDAAAPEVGGGATFMIARGFGRWHQAVAYSILTSARGRYAIGPVSAQSTDPFGLARRTVTSAGHDSMLRVTPHIWNLDQQPVGAGLGAAGDATAQRIGQAGADDVLVREHRHGDDMRRVHWKMSAKRDDLMVRLEEHPWDPSSTLIVDTRLSAHPDHGPHGSLEWCVSAVASVATLLLTGRSRLSVLAPSGTVYTSGHSGGALARQSMLEAMTDLQSSRLTWLGEAFTDPETLSSAASVIAVTGLLSAKDAAALGAAAAAARVTVALVPDADAWGGPNPEHDDACRLLSNQGWSVVSYAPGQSVPEVWERVIP